jgi:short-subunit dehydrogenase
VKALITGAANGLGRAMTDQLLEAGHEVWAVDRDTDALDDLAIKSRGSCRVVLADLANPSSIQRLLRDVKDVKFDLVVLNAGISATGRFEEIPGAAYEKLIAINLTAPLVVASQLMRQNNMAPKSQMVFISSLSHAVGYPGASVYAATKDALAIYAKSVRKPFKKRGVGVTAVFPGPIRTEHAERYSPKGAKANKRMLPEDMAKLILKAASKGKKELYAGKGAGAAKFFGKLAPNMMSKMMRKVIFDKLDSNTY